MTRWWPLPLAVLVACDGGGSDKSGDDDDDDDDDDTTQTYWGFDCAVTDRDDLTQETPAGREAECESSPYWGYEPMATVFYQGEVHWDECGTVRGRELWLYFANDAWASLGAHDCVVAFDLEGTATQVGTDVSLAISAVIDPADTTCGDILDYKGDSFLDYIDQTWEQTYEVSVSGDGSAEFWFSGNASEPFAYGSANASHARYLSTVTCQLY